MRLLLIEDEAKTRNQLIQYIKNYAPDWQIKAQCDSIQEALSYLAKPQEFDLMLSDIELTDGNIMSVIDEFPVSLPVIFITAYDQYLQKAFEVNSIHYITKPIEKQQLFKALDKFQELKLQYSSDTLSQFISIVRNAELQQTYKQKFLAQLKDTFVLVDIKDIALFEVEEGIVFLETSNQRMMLKERSLEEILPALNPKKFMRINRQMIINKEFIQEVKPFDKNTISVKVLSEWVRTSQGQSQKFRKWLDD